MKKSIEYTGDGGFDDDEDFDPDDDGFGDWEGVDEEMLTIEELDALDDDDDDYDDLEELGGDIDEGDSYIPF